MDELNAAAVAQHNLDVAAAAADDLRGLVGGLRRQATRDFAAVSRHHKIRSHFQ